MEDIFKLLDFDVKRIKVDEKFLNHLRYAHGIAISDNIHKFQESEKNIGENRE